MEESSDKKHLGALSKLALTLGALVATVPIVYNIEKYTGVVQGTLGDIVLERSTNTDLGHVWQDYNDYLTFQDTLNGDCEQDAPNKNTERNRKKRARKKRKCKKKPHKKIDNPFPDLSVLDQLPYTKDNRIRIISSDEPPIILEDKVTRIYVPHQEIPEHTKQLFVWKEDQDFYDHHGINLWGKVRALNSLLFGDRLIGGSGFTEQLAKMMMTPRDQLPYREGFGGLVQKGHEIAVACAIENKFEEQLGSKKAAKDKILELYLNLAYFGNGKYGIGAASQFYFNKPASGLTKEESLFLAVMLPRPSVNPVTRSGFEYHWNNFGNVLVELVAEDLMTKEEAHILGRWKSVEITPQERHRTKLSSALGTAYEELRRRRGIDVYQLITDRDPPFGFEAQLTASLQMTRDLQQSVRQGFNRRNAELGSIVMNQDAEIVAILMGKDNHSWANMNFATRTNRGLASTMKAILLAVGIESGLVDLHTTYDDTCAGLSWCPRNWDGGSGRTMTLESALYNSNNRIFTKLYREIKQDIGVEGFAEMMEKLGFDGASFLEAARHGDAVAIGARGGSPKQLAGAYIALATGEYKEPTIIRSLSFGGVVPEFIEEEREATELFSHSTVSQVKRALGNIGRSYRGDNPNIFVGIKTGTASRASHLYIAGYFMPRINNHEIYSLALLAVPTSGRSLGRNAYASTMLGPIVGEFIRRFASRTPELSEDELLEIAMVELKEDCDNLFHQYSSQTGTFYGRYHDWGESERLDDLRRAETELRECRDAYGPDENQSLFFELSRGVVAFEAASSLEDGIDSRARRVIDSLPDSTRRFMRDYPQDFDDDLVLALQRMTEAGNYRAMARRALLGASLSNHPDFSRIADGYLGRI